MKHPPPNRPLAEPGKPRWRHWGMVLVPVCAAVFFVLLLFWPDPQPRAELWLWGAVAPVCGLLLLATRVLAWRLALFERTVDWQARDAATQRWWTRQQRALPLRQVLLLGPAGDEPDHYQQLMALTPLPTPVPHAGSGGEVLRCPLSLQAEGERHEALAQHLARMTLVLPDLAERWPSLRGIAWMGDGRGHAAYVQALADAGMQVPAAHMPLHDLADLDALIDAFNRECRSESDWLLCAGVRSLEPAQDSPVPGEGGFVWWVGWGGRMRLHRGEFLHSEAGESAIQACAQVQRYAGLEKPPSICVVLGEACVKAFATGGWPMTEHQVAAHWGELNGLSAFVAMSLALLQASDSGQPCGWLSQDQGQRLAIGMAVPHGEC